MCTFRLLVEWNIWVQSFLYIKLYKQSEFLVILFFIFLLSLPFPSLSSSNPLFDFLSFTPLTLSSFRYILLNEAHDIKIGGFRASHALSVPGGYVELKMNSKLPAKWLSIETLTAGKFSSNTDSKCKYNQLLIEGVQLDFSLPSIQNSL